MPQPVFLVTVDDQRANGRIVTPGWSGDFLFGDDKHAEQSSDKKAVKPIDQWEQEGCIYLDSFKGIAPRGTPDRKDMLLTEWLPSSIGKWDDKARPVLTPRTRFLHFYDGSANPVGIVTSTKDFAPNWCAWIVRYASPAETTLKEANVSIKMHGAGLGYPSWRLYIPTRSESVKTPCLCLDPYSTTANAPSDSMPPSQERVVAVSEMDTTAGLEGGAQWYFIACELTLNQWLIRIATNGNWDGETWAYSPPGTDVGNPHLHDAAGLVELPICSPGRIEFQSVGQQALFAFAPMVYPAFSQARLRKSFVVDSRFGSPARATDPLTVDVVGAMPTGTAMAAGNVAAELEADPSDKVRPQVQFFTNGSVRPVCGVVGVNLPAVIGDVVTSPWTSATYKFGAADKISYTRRATWQGNEFHASFRDPEAALDWKGNEVAKLSLGLANAGETPTLVDFVTGYLVGPSREQDGGDAARVAVDVMDFAGSRMKRKNMIYTRSFGGFAFSDAFKEAGNRLGFSSDRISLTDCDDLYLPTPQVIGEPQFAYDHEDEWDEALTAMCRTVDRVWGITSDGKLFAQKRYADTGTYAYTIDSDAVAAGDWIISVDSKRDLENFANNVYIISGEEGYRQFAWARNEDSEKTSTSGWFVGDTFQHAEQIDKQVASASAIADAVLAKKLSLGQTIVWRPMLPKLTVWPGCYVKCQIEKMDITTDSVWFVTEESGNIDPLNPTQFGWEQVFTMVRVS